MKKHCISGTVQYLVATATWHSGFVRHLFPDFLIDSPEEEKTKTSLRLTAMTDLADIKELLWLLLCRTKNNNMMAAQLFYVWVWKS